MKIHEVIDRGLSSTRRLIPLSEMAFRLRVIRERLRAQQWNISYTAVKILIFPQVQEISHWKREILAWAIPLSLMERKRIHGPTTPIGFNLVWEHLYREPFEGHDLRTINAYFKLLQREYPTFPMTSLAPSQTMTLLKTFLHELCQAIGEGDIDRVDAVVQQLGT